MFFALHPLRQKEQIMRHSFSEKFFRNGIGERTNSFLMMILTIKIRVNAYKYIDIEPDKWYNDINSGCILFIGTDRAAGLPVSAA